MFDIGIGEILIVAIIGLLVFGPERLPQRRPTRRNGSSRCARWRLVPVRTWRTPRASTSATPSTPSSPCRSSIHAAWRPACSTTTRTRLSHPRRRSRGPGASGGVAAASSGIRPGRHLTCRRPRVRPFAWVRCPATFRPGPRSAPERLGDAEERDRGRRVRVAEHERLARVAALAQRHVERDPAEQRDVGSELARDRRRDDLAAAHPEQVHGLAAMGARERARMFSTTPATFWCVCSARVPARTATSAEAGCGVVTTTISALGRSCAVEIATSPVPGGRSSSRMSRSPHHTSARNCWRARCSIGPRNATGCACPPA